MKLNFEITVDADLDTVWAAFDNTDNLSRWQQNFQSYAPVSGTPRQPGAVASLRYNENGKPVTLTETVTERAERRFISASYESANGSTIIVNYFEVIDDRKTRWKTWCNFTFSGLMRLMSPFFSGSIRKRTEADMQRFKLMVETDQAAR